MRFAALTIFPEIIEVYLKYGILGRAIRNGIIEAEVFNLRDFTEDKHRTVDDYPFGGGPGMVMKAEPFFKFYDFYTERYGKSYVVLTSPQGMVFDNKKALELSQKKNIVFFCGRYEGIDERVLDIVDEELSIGDFVLSGGEIAALAIMDATARFVKGVVEEESVKKESFMNDLLDHPVYTRPRIVRGKGTPDVLLSGDHEKIEIWRRKEAMKKTILKRPDLFMKKENFDRVDKLALIELFKELTENAK
ncbi:MAG: tRNA (guanosine(37)-N1)-methyltransferase TrmD [Thermotogaceae bacterium]|nr:tRNA (guanosine(37)-N1)-methyltransferase TrmD [Thermotogaceae bacterium]